jgi:hypothetical protein
MQRTEQQASRTPFGTVDDALAETITLPLPSAA